MAQIVGYFGGYGVGDTTVRTNTTGTPPVALGAVGLDNAGNEYRYIRAGGVIPVNSACMVTSSATPFDVVVVTTGANLALAGVATAAFALNDCGWILKRGATSVITAGSVAVTTPQTTAAAGAFANAAAGDVNNAVGFVLVNTASPQVCYVDAV